jgi:hypothetical protein
MWDHLTHYKLVPGLDEYRRIAARAAHLADRNSVAHTAPAASLAAAAAADAAATTAASPPAAR